MKAPLQQWPCTHESCMHYSGCAGCEGDMLDIINRITAILTDRVGEDRFRAIEAIEEALGLRSTSARKTEP